MKHYHLKEIEWEFIKTYLKEVKCIRKTEDIRPFIEGILFIFKGGCQWRLLPGCMVNGKQYKRALSNGRTKESG
ncbi:MAG: hypothetical protein P857_783 [Candidatus Xenolissoclinum pacificiensis L6]|uniref:Insertion element IS402-like domain-containing protein n=1 Tax=Candidatus Xenolissoclinum pacificiensis L6 TaxID=1401685 RepID=W2V047_9RICK|nr:MAG: hypothetical protein P857_783 [Candidatus Xenolissoclinum pacificiensis L6]